MDLCNSNLYYSRLCCAQAERGGLGGEHVGLLSTAVSPTWTSTCPLKGCRRIKLPKATFGSKCLKALFLNWNYLFQQEEKGLWLIRSTEQSISHHDVMVEERGLG